MESEPKLSPREKSSLPEKFSPEEDRTHDAASSRTTGPTHYQRVIPAPQAEGRYRLVGVVVKASASRAENPRFDSRLLGFI